MVEGLFSYSRHPAVMHWLITPALRLNWVISIPGSMELEARTSRNRSPSHVAPGEKDKDASRGDRG